MCVCVFLSMCGCIFVCIYVHVCVCMYMSAHLYMCVLEMSTHLCVMCMLCVCACTRVHVCMCAHVLERTIQLLLRVTPHPQQTPTTTKPSLCDTAWTYSCSFWFLTLFPILWWHNHWWWVQIRGCSHRHLSTDVHNLSGNSLLAWSSGCCLKPWQKL